MANKTYYEVPTNFQDTISDLAFAEQQRYLAATSWDGMICVWEFNNEYLSPALKKEHKDTNKNAYLRCCFNPDCDQIFFGTSHGEIYSLAINSAKGTTPTKFYEHKTGPIVGLKICTQKTLLVAVALDCKILIFLQDTIATVQINMKPINIDISGTYLYVVALGQAIFFIDLGSATLKDSDSAQKLLKVAQSQLQYQIKSISVSKNKPDRYIIGSIYGQCEIIDGSTRNIVNCHREENHNQIFSSNCVAMVAEYPWAISGGGNGTLKMINFEKPKGGRDFPFYNIPLTAVAVSSRGEVAAVAQGYDWQCGAEIYKTEKLKVALYIKKLAQQEF